jgi:glycosyltransferase involved in cell wall biosynthesis
VHGVIIGCLRIKNESRWLSRVLRSIQPLCDRILVFDDHSTDDSREIAASEGAEVIRSPFTGLDEARDKGHMLENYLIPANPDVVIAIDGDEVLTQESIPIIREVAARPNVARCSFRILYLWDREDQIRTDGVYRDFRRSSMFRVRGQRGLSFASTSHGGNFHCKSVPQGLRGVALPIEAELLHFGYLHREDRIRKFEWYRANDANSTAEDGYRHIVQGDVPDVPASARLKHAGPLTLESLHVMA